MTSTFRVSCEREHWRTTMLLVWKYGPLRSDDGSGHHGPIVKLVSEFAAPPWPTQPLRKLTANLITTYTGINTRYYAAKQKWIQNQPLSSDFKWQPGQSLTLQGRYRLLRPVGSGTFGVVMRALDRSTGETVAIKIVRAGAGYSAEAKREIGLLQHLHRGGDCEAVVVKLLGHFQYHNPGVGCHQCLVFEHMTSDLHTFMRAANWPHRCAPLPVVSTNERTNERQRSFLPLTYHDSHAFAVSFAHCLLSLSARSFVL